MAFCEFLEEGVDGLGFRPEGLVEEDHGTHDSQRGVVILGDVLEDFRDRYRAAWREDDAVDGDGDETFFAQAVGNVGGEERGGGVTIEPSGDAETIASLTGLGVAFANFEGADEPLEITVAWGFGEDAEGVFQFAVRPFGKPGAEVRGLHGAGAAAAD